MNYNIQQFGLHIDFSKYFHKIVLLLKKKIQIIHELLNPL